MDNIEQFWIDVIDAVQQVITDQSRVITVERNNKRAEVAYMPTGQQVAIYIGDSPDNNPPQLIVPT